MEQWITFAILLTVCASFFGVYLLQLSTSILKTKHYRKVCRIIGWGCFVLVVLLGIFLSAYAHAEDRTALESTKESRAEYIAKRIIEGDVECNKIPMTDRILIEKGVVIERPVVLCAFKESDQSWRMIHLQLLYPVSPAYNACVNSASSLLLRRACILPLRVITPGYRIVHLGGYGVTRMIFDVWDGNEKLIVYRTRHVWLDDDALASKDVVRIRQTAIPINYTPYHPDFHDAEMVNKGIALMRDRIHSAQKELRTRRVYSRAFPKKLLSDVVPYELPLVLAAIEQIDDMKFRDDNQGSMEAAYIEYALNGDRAFMWSRSGANALGALQFTRATYEEMVVHYPEVKLIPDFEAGARNLTNVLTAAICLIDYENAKFPPIIPIYERNPILGGFYAVAAYNGGPPWARELYRLLREKKIDIETSEVEIPHRLTLMQRLLHLRSAPKKHKVVALKAIHNTETPGYVQKYLSGVNFYERRLREEVEHQ